MYTARIPFKDYKKNPQNQQVQLNLDEREVFKNLVQLQRMFKWIESIESKELIELPTEEVVAFYDDLEHILLASYGKMTDDGLRFDKSGRYEFEDSALFNALMVKFVTDPPEATKMLTELLPDGMEELVKNAEVDLEKMSKDPSTTAAMQAQIDQLQAQLRESKGGDAKSGE